MNRRKPCEIKIQQNAYIRHLKKIQQLMNGNSPNQRKARQENSKILSLMSNSHKIHELSKSQKKLLQQKSIRQINNMNSYTIRKAESIVGKEIQKSMIKIPQRYSRKLYQDQIDRENQKLQKRLVQSKPYVISNLSKAYISQRKLPPISKSFDFSRLYFESPTSQFYNKRQKIVVKLSKKKNKSIQFQFVGQQLMKNLKQNQNSLVLIQIRYNGHKVKIPSRTYQQISRSDIIVQFNYRQKAPQLQFRFNKAFQEKNQNLYRGNIFIDIKKIDQQQIQSSQFCCLKQQLKYNDRKLGQIEIRAKAKALVRKIMNTVRNTIEQQQQKENFTRVIKKYNKTEHIQYGCQVDTQAQYLSKNALSCNPKQFSQQISS